MLSIDAFHLPALVDPPVRPWSYETSDGSVVLRVPRLTPEHLSGQLDAMLKAREKHLAGRPVAEIVGIVDRVAARFLDPGDELRTRAEESLAAVTRLSRPMVRHVLDGMAADWRRDRLLPLIAAELGDARVLDGFTTGAVAGVRSRAFGPDLAVHVFSGNVPGVGVTSMIRTLLLKSATLGKSASDEPVLPALFAQALFEENVGLGSCIAVTYWRGGDEPLEQVAFERAGVVIAYGGQETIRSVRSRVPPHVPLRAYGHRLSFGVVAREALGGKMARRVAADAAMAVATFDQQGCVSPHLFYVEEGGRIAPDEWARLLAEGMRDLEETLPRGELTPQESATIRQVRGEAEFAQLAGTGIQLHASENGTAWTVIYDPDASFVPSCLNRVVRVKPVAMLDELPGRVASFAQVLQTVGVAGPPARLEALAADLGRVGVSRIAPIARMAWPPPTWHHDGRPPLADLVRWCDWEVT